MIVADFHVIGIIVRAPHKADSPLVVDPDTVLSTPVALQRFKSVAWRVPKVVHDLRCVQHFQLSTCGTFNVAQALYRLPIE